MEVGVAQLRGALTLLQVAPKPLAAAQPEAQRRTMVARQREETPPREEARRAVGVHGERVATVRPEAGSGGREAQGKAEAFQKVHLPM